MEVLEEDAGGSTDDVRDRNVDTSDDESHWGCRRNLERGIGSSEGNRRTDGKVDDQAKPAEAVQCLWSCNCVGHYRVLRRSREVLQECRSRPKSGCVETRSGGVGD